MAEQHAHLDVHGQLGHAEFKVGDERSPSGCLPVWGCDPGCRRRASPDNMSLVRVVDTTAAQVPRGPCSKAGLTWLYVS